MRVLLLLILISLTACKSPTRAVTDGVQKFYESNGEVVTTAEAMNPFGDNFLQFGKPKKTLIEGPLVRPETAKQAWESEREAERRRSADLSWGIFKKVSLGCVIPGMVLMGLSFFAPVAGLRNAGTFFLGTAIVTAIIPWVMDRFAPALLWPAAIVGGMCLALGVATVAYRVIMGHKLNDRIEAVKAKYDLAVAEENPQEAALHLGALIALERTNDPNFEKKREWEPMVENNMANWPQLEESST